MKPQRRSSWLVQAEVAQLVDLIDSIPPGFAGGAVRAPYQARLNCLLDELLDAQSSELALSTARNVQQFRLRNGPADSNAIEPEHLVVLVRHWPRLLASAVSQPKDGVTGSVGKAMRDSFLVHPAARGSFVLRLSSSHEAALDAFNAVAVLFAGGSNLTIVRELWRKFPALDAAAVGAVLTLFVDNQLAAEISCYAPDGSVARSVRLDWRAANEALNVLANAEEHTVVCQLDAQLIAAHLQRMRIEFEASDGSQLAANVSNAAELRGMRLGSAFKVSVRRTTTVHLATGISTVADTVESFESVLDREDMKQEPHETVARLAEGTLAGHLVPQANDLARLHRLLQAALLRNDIPPDAIGVGSDRWIDYYRASARILGFMREDGQLSRRGRIAAAMPSDEFVRYAATFFELSECGMAWLEFAGATTLVELQPGSAEDFLRYATYGLSEHTVQRRANTLRTWVREMQAVRQPRLF